MMPLCINGPHGIQHFAAASLPPVLLQLRHSRNTQGRGGEDEEGEGGWGGGVKGKGAVLGICVANGNVALPALAPAGLH